MTLFTILAISGVKHAKTGNWIVDTFLAGGPIMWPLLVVSIVAVTVVLERVVWWIRYRTRRETAKLEQVYSCLETGDIKAASAKAGTSQDPRVQLIWHGLNHSHNTMQGAVQVHSGITIKKASTFLGVMDTVVTLAPLLGLLGTVTGIMAAFSAVGEGGLNVDAVSGGIGEALIATAAGLSIAMFSLIPYNYFTSKVEELKFELETTATNLEVLLENLKEKNEAELTAAS
jgi:biopolymer transport protein ExbB